MPDPTQTETVDQGVFDYLCVDDFIRTLTDARAVKIGFELRLIDLLQESSELSARELATQISTDSQGLLFLLGMLQSNHVVELNRDKYCLSERFRQALKYRDILELKIDFADLVAVDFVDLFTWMIRDPGRFMRESRLFQLFDYQRCFEATPENHAKTKEWMRFTTTLTRYEARVCTQFHTLSQAKRMLDIGGNSGEFALQICRKEPSIHVTIFDLPVVCDVGREHLSIEPEADRIQFLPGNALNDPLPTGFDLITFKSMLHDWPEAQAIHMLRKAAAALEPGGTLLIFERGPINVVDRPIPYSMIPIILFFRSFRGPSLYATQLATLGFEAVSIQEIRLDVPFFLISAKKPQHAQI